MTKRLLLLTHLLLEWLNFKCVKSSIFNLTASFDYLSPKQAMRYFGFIIVNSTVGYIRKRGVREKVRGT